MIHRRLTFVLALALGAAGLAGCEYAGPGDDNPVSRSLTWFSYVGGQDIRKACAPGAPDRFRFVYNGVYGDQVRSYDVHMLPDGRSASLSVWVKGEPDLSEAQPILKLGNVWSGTRAPATMPFKGVQDLRRALAADGFRDYRPVGLQLPSDAYYWTAVACVDGRFVSNAWLYPSGRFKSLKFPAVLKDYDRTGVAFREARPQGWRHDYERMESADNPGSGPFYIRLDRDGFTGANALF